MPVARGNVAFDLSALSTSLAKRTGAPGGGSADVPDAETYINELESKVAGLQGALDDANANWAAVAEERDALEKQLVDQAKEIVEQEEELKQEKRRNQHLQDVNRALEEALRKSQEPPSETEKAASSALEGGDDDGQDAVPVPPPQPAPPACVVDDLDEPMDAPQGDDLEKALQELVCKANKMEKDVVAEGLYSQYEDFYLAVRNAEYALTTNRVEAYLEMVNRLESEIEDVEKDLEDQQAFNKSEGLDSHGDKKKRRGKASARRR